MTIIPHKVLSWLLKHVRHDADEEQRKDEEAVIDMITAALKKGTTSKGGSKIHMMKGETGLGVDEGISNIHPDTHSEGCL